MKRSSPFRKLTCFLFGLCISAMLFCSQAKELQAEKQQIVEEDGSGILQSGGMLTEVEEVEILRFRSAAPDYTGAEKAVANAIKNFRTSVDVSSYRFQRLQFREFFQDFLNHHPEFFYLGDQYSYSLSGNYVQTLYIQYASTSTSELNRMVKTYEKKVREILSYIDSSWSPLEKALYVNDYLAVNCQYDLTLQNFDAYDALISRTAVCQGYTLAYMDLMNRMNIPCEIVSSNSMNHIWNLVQINGSWYHVDATWNDPSNDYCGRANHNFLLKSTSWFLSSEGEHNASDHVYSGSLSSDDASNTRYDNYFWNTVNTPFSYSGGYWYSNVNHSIKEFTGGSTGLTERRTVISLNNIWPVWGSTSSYWSGTYDGCNVFAGILYYATPTSIQALDLATGQAVSPAPYTLSASEQSSGYLYGFYIAKDGTMEYAVSESPQTPGTRRRVSIHSHTFGNWNVLSAGTCTGTGEQTRYCGTCGYHEEQDIPATGHLHTKTTKKAATFLKKGSSKTVCQDCGSVLESKTLAKIACKKNQVYTVGNYKYKIISPKTNGKGTVAFYRLAKNVSKVSTGDTVTILGVKFKVVQISEKALKNRSSVTSITIGKNVQSIGKEAFYGTKKLKNMTIKSTSLTKVGSNALKNTYAKAKIKVPKGKVTKYKALFKNKGQKKTVKIY